MAGINYIYHRLHLVGSTWVYLPLSLVNASPLDTHRVKVGDISQKHLIGRESVAVMLSKTALLPFRWHFFNT